MTDTPNTTQGKGVIDWSKPIEAVNEDGTVSPVSLYNHREWPDADGDWQVRDVGKGQWSYFRADGTHADAKCPWRIRNVPEHPTPTQYAPELVTKAVDLVKRLASADLYTAYAHEFVADARSIIFDLPQEVDLDLIAAREVVEECDCDGRTFPASWADRKAYLEQIAYAGIARGRQLQRGEAA